MRYRNRTDAGLALVGPLREAGFGVADLVSCVLGVARGGVVVAAPIAEAFAARLGVVVARKLGAPGNPELAIGAVGSGGEAFVDKWLARRLRVSDVYLEAEIARQRDQVRERVRRYGVDSDMTAIARRQVVVVDDGVATGATLIAALRSVREAKPAKLYCAVPVGPAETYARLEHEADVIVCPHQPAGFAAVGQWYRDFTQTSDEEVLALLQRSED